MLVVCAVDVSASLLSCESDPDCWSDIGLEFESELELGTLHVIRRPHERRRPRPRLRFSAARDPCSLTVVEMSPCRACFLFCREVPVLSVGFLASSRVVLLLSLLLGLLLVLVLFVSVELSPADSASENLSGIELRKRSMVDILVSLSLNLSRVSQESPPMRASSAVGLCLRLAARLLVEPVFGGIAKGDATSPWYSATYRPRKIPIIGTQRQQGWGRRPLQRH